MLARGRLNTAVAKGVARAIVRLNARLANARRRPEQSSGSERVYRFVVYTFVTDDDQYREMRESFYRAGFSPPLAEFVPLRDRRSPEGSDPYELISRLGEGGADAAHCVLVHQDVRLDRGAGAAELIAALEELDRLDPLWFVAGDAGATSDLRIVRRLHDPHGGGTGDPMPCRVITLDENLLVLNPARSPHCSPGLSGFHLYGTDVCLNAREAGGAAYVIDFPVTHLSAGYVGPEYRQALSRLTETWQPRFGFAYVLTPNGLVFLSRWILLRWIFGSRRLCEWVWTWGRQPRPLDAGVSASTAPSRDV